MGDQIDVSYRGISVGSGLAARDFGAGTVFVEVEQPMPVGTRVDVTAGDVAFVARVVHVDEKAEGVEQPGMRIEGIELSEAARAWWAERAPASDEPASGEPEAVADEQPSDAARTAVMDAVDLEEIERLAKEEQAAEFEARQREAEQAMEDKPDDESSSTSNGRRKRRRKRKRKRR